jgi:hypothetical protein
VCELKKTPFTIIVIVLLVCFCDAVVFAAEPYYNYTYDFNGQIQQEPQAYLPSGIIDGEMMGTTDLNALRMSLYRRATKSTSAIPETTGS